MATFSRLLNPHPQSPPPTLPCPTQHLEGNSGVTLHCSGCEQSSPFMHANMGRGGGGGGWSEGLSLGKGGVAVGRRSRLSFQCEEGGGRRRGGGWRECFQMFRQQRNLTRNEVSRTHTHTHSTRLSVFMYSVQLEGPGRQTCAWIWVPLHCKAPPFSICEHCKCLATGL